MDREIYKEQYQFEWTRKANFATALNTPLVVITVLGGAIVALAQNYTYNNSFNSIFFCFCLLTSALSITYSIFNIFRAFHGHVYKGLPSPKILKDHYQEVLEWHNNKGLSNEIAINKFEENINQLLANATDINIIVNDTKSAFLFKCNRSLAICIVFLGLSGAAYIQSNLRIEEKVHQVQIVNINSKLKGDIEMSNSENDKQNEKPVETDTAPDLPVLRDIKENSVPKKVD